MSPPRDEYVPTELGRALWPALRALGLWGRAFNPDARPMRTFHHAECGTELGSYGECRACGRAIDPEDVEMRPGPGLSPAEDPVSRALRAPPTTAEPLENQPQ
ncbi:winged helix-turn-helix transcriptional regulator [Streptomyces violascens]|uniref:winged helix-turn-helix transcriptional regulator n=1 Tax=Streptomyces violascens TaxID=67381 RepID=UPI0036818345